MKNEKRIKGSEVLGESGRFYGNEKNVKIYKKDYQFSLKCDIMVEQI